MPLRLRRGTNAERLTITPIEGELIYTTDTKVVYVGDGSTLGGNLLVGSTSPGGNLSSNLNLNSYNITGTGNVTITGNINNGTLTLNQDAILSSNNFIAPVSGNTIGILTLSKENNLLQIKRNWKESIEPLELQYGITNGASSLIESKNTSRGTISLPTPVSPGDALTIDRIHGYDGFDYVLSSSIWQGVDPFGSVSPGMVTGSIALTTQGLSGENIAVFDSAGRFSINKFPLEASEVLDVVGNGIFSGEVTASAFKGTFVADDSTLLLDGANNFLSNGILSLDNSILTSNTNTLSFGTQNSSITITRFCDETILPHETIFGLTNNTFSGRYSRSFSRGTISSPLAVQSSDSLGSFTSSGFDGTAYVLSSAIFQGVDPTQPVSLNSVPGFISLITVNNGVSNIVSYNSSGYFGINKEANTTSEALDVLGNGLFSGDVTAAAFKGTFVADDSTIVIDGLNGTVTGNTVTSNGFVMFGSYDATGRSGLTAANGMVIYNTTANRFQGYQNGAWINLDDGSAAP